MTMALLKKATIELSTSDVLAYKQYLLDSDHNRLYFIIRPDQTRILYR